MIEIDQNHITYLTNIRHQLHSMAELSGYEKNTAAFIQGLMEQCHPDEIIANLGGDGIAAVFDSKIPGPTLLLRAELDALPIRETITLDYASKNSGVSHKCGHDGHMAILVGAANLAAKHKIQKGKLIVLFQPAEETGQGATAIMNDERFTALKPDYAFALHNLPGYPKNSIILRKGNFAAASRGLIIRLKGHTSHAGHPEDANAPTLAFSGLIKDLTALPVSISGFNEPAIITVVHARLGAVAFGTTPGDAEILATLRTYDNTLMQKLADRVSILAHETAKAFGLECEVAWTEVFDPTINTAEEVEVLKEISQKAGLEIIEKERPFPWSEDFGTFTEAFKGALFGIGAGLKTPQLHQEEYDFPDQLLPQGVEIFTGLINHYLGLGS